MSYLKFIEHDLRKLVKSTPPDTLADEIARYVRAKVYESYQNGVTVGQGKPLPRAGEPNSTAQAARVRR